MADDVKVLREAAEYDITWARAEEIVGCRVDRRRKYAFIEGQLCELAEWTTSCSGCFECGDYGQGSEHYPWDEKNHCHIGAGCHECGHHGKIRQRMWVPSEYAIAHRAALRRGGV